VHITRVAIWETGEWPEEWTFSTFIPLPKKGDLNKTVCKLQNVIAIVSYASNILLRIILEKNPSKDRNRNCRRRGGIPTRKGDKRDQIVKHQNRYTGPKFVSFSADKTAFTRNATQPDNDSARRPNDVNGA